MSGYKVFLTAVCKKKLAKADAAFQRWFDKVLDQVAENPLAGKPLGVHWFREKKFGKMRVYYVVYEDLKGVFVVNLSEKKDQQQVINSIKSLFDVYRQEIERLLGLKV